MLPAPAMAHPHSTIEAAVEVRFGADAQILSVHQRWIFDTLFSADLLALADADRDGRATPEEWTALAVPISASLAEFFFLTTIVTGDDAPVGFMPMGAQLTYDERFAVATMTFDLILLGPATEATIAIVDPTLNYQFYFVPMDPVTLVDAPATCT